jgi:hypothetical protein
MPNTQDGNLEDLNLGFLSPSGGALFWMSPCISFSIVVGLGLDYGTWLPLPRSSECL